MYRLFHLGMLVLTASSLVSLARATETENLGIRILPAPGKIAIDGKADDWDLSGGIFVCPDAENQRDDLSVWFHAMYDQEYLYLLARFNDDTPLNSTRDPNFDFGWNGDCLQVRVTTDPGGPRALNTHFTCWQGLGGKHVVDMAHDFHKDGWKGKDMRGAGLAQQAMTINADRKGYVQEVAVSWKIHSPDGAPPKAGSTMRMALQAWWSGGQWGATLSDLFMPNVALDKVFTFGASPIWGPAVLSPSGNVQPQPVRLADSREFAVRLEKGVPIVDWTGLIKSREPQGFADIAFTAPDDGYVSLNIRNKDGQVVRQLLTANFFGKGTHTAKWDGLTTPQWRTPGQPVEPGDYRWDAIYHQGIGLKWRGYACSSPTAAPWDGEPGTGWGGDMGDPAACAAEGDTVLLGWHGAEAGKAAVAVDLGGRVRWRHKRGGIGGASLVAMDRGIAYLVDGGSVIYKVRAVEGTVEPWESIQYGEMNVTAIFPEPKGVAATVSGISAHDGKLYLAFPLRSFARDDVRDWKLLLERISKPTDAVIQAFWDRLGAMPNVAGSAERGTVGERITNWLADKNANENGLLHHGWQRDVRDQVIDVLNALVTEPTLAPDAAKLTPSQLASANRKRLEASLGDLVVKAAEPGIAVVDGKSGRLIKTIPFLGAGAMCAVSDSLVYVLVDGTLIAALDPLSGQSKPCVGALKSARGLAADFDGNIYVSVGDTHQVKVFSPEGKLVRSIGREGGRAPLGPWNPDGMLSPNGLAIDYHGKLWVAESDLFPRRISVWDARSGKFEREYFGGTHYGASGGAINPRDPDVMVGQGCEWRLDSRTGQAELISVFDRSHLHSFARFCQGANGREYLAVTVPHLFMGAREVGVKIFERLPDGQYKLRATVLTSNPDGFTPTPQDPGGDKTFFWADRNDDQKSQPEELQVMPKYLTLGGYYHWSMYLNTDLTITCAASPSVAKRGEVQGMTIKVKSFTDCGAPVYDVEHAGPILPGAAVASHGLLSPDGKFLAEMGDSTGAIRCFEVSTGKLQWTYPNPWLGVHASHVAPPPEPGLIRGSFGIVGSAKLPAPVKAIWAINSNCGEWHLLTAEGFYLSRLFQPDAMKVRWPEAAVPGADMTDAASGLGGEDFGGSLTQAADGKIYVEAGKVAYWNLEVTGLDSVRQIKGNLIRIDAKGVAQAERFREKYLQTLRGVQRLEVRKLTPTLSGDTAKDFAGAAWVEFKKQDDAAVKAAATWDDNNLYLAWQVADATPWVNSASSAEYMYLYGDTVDFQLATDSSADKNRAEAGAGDLRLSIGSFKDQPTAMLYRRVASAQKPMKFSSGVAKDYVMQYVGAVPEVIINVTKSATGYSVEATVPLAVLGLSPKPDLTLSGDFGATHGDPNGQRTRLRTYWCNQETGLVDDAVFELMMSPRNWGRLLFVAPAPGGK